LAWLDKLSSKPAVLGLSVLAAFLLQTSVFTHLAVLGVKPDLLMVVVACWGLLYGPRAGFVAGMVTGLAQGVMLGQYIGLFALVKALVGFAVGVVESKIFKENIWVPTVAVGAAVLAHEFLVWLCLKVLGVPTPAVTILTVAVPGSVYSMLAAPLAYRQLFLYNVAERAREESVAGGAGQATARR